ncbi:menaquinone biosynthetic enzyme MqnA/MqnD family protein [Pelotalea chapellei]|uniref:Chorismate dehydratase n=1 Tax=Pelotalea chapellei TaxID=44671 RepID=A0ABS5U7P9_9BACT|nr:menaquinone biosynthesis protein [Pelotalea chapellei]MBT1071695.1 menaquinone biosynthesis protein [Pelotalea chapellei]
MLRIGRIEYANCTPIFHALHELFDVHGEYEYVGGVPSSLNRMLAAAEIDVCPSSSIEFAFHPDKHLIIPELSISSCGPVQSVLLFATIPIEELGGKEILLSSESATSVNLLKILIKKRYNLDCMFRVTSKGLSAALLEAPAVLLIGDPALRAVQSAHNVHVYDLGELWYQWTGTPFVFALWLVSRNAYEQKSEELRKFVRRVWKAREYALRHLDQIAESSQDALWMGCDNLLQYWRKNISYELTPAHIEAVSTFFDFAEEMKLITAAPRLSFIDL